MNVLIITEDDVFYLYAFFRRFFALAVGAPYRLTAITVMAAFNKKSPAELARQMLGFYGPLDFLRMGVWYAFNKATGRTVARLAARQGLEALPARSVNAPEYVAAVRERKTDAILSIAAPQIFRRELIAAAPRGCINSHSSLLPENRGMMPVFWGMYKGDTHIGVTVHYINEELDKGDIIRQERVPVGKESLHEMILKTKEISARLVHESLCDIAAGRVLTAPMPAGGSYQTFPTPAEAREFRRRGHRII